MKRAKECPMGKLIKPWQDENGSVLLTTVIIMLLLSLIGVSGINTASMDLQITRNYRIHKENLVLADAAVNLAMTSVERQLDRNIIGRDWVADMGDGFYLVEDLHNKDTKYFKKGSAYNPLIHPVVNELDVTAILDDWGTIDEIKSQKLPSESDAEFVAYIQVSVGNLDERTTSAVVIARSHKNGGNVVLEKGIIYSD